MKWQNEDDFENSYDLINKRERLSRPLCIAFAIFHDLSIISHLSLAMITSLIIHQQTGAFKSKLNVWLEQLYVGMRVLTVFICSCSCQLVCECFDDDTKMCGSNEDKKRQISRISLSHTSTLQSLCVMRECEKWSTLKKRKRHHTTSPPNIRK